MAQPRQMIDPPATFSPHPFGLFSVVNWAGTGAGHWQNGVSWTAHCPDGVQSTFDECIAVTGSGPPPEPAAKIAPRGQVNRTATVGIENRGATAFTVVALFECSLVGNGDAAAIAQQALAQTEQWQVERSLWTGVAGGQSVVFPHLAADESVVDAQGFVLQSTTSTPITGAAVDAAIGLGILEQEMANCFGGTGIVHVPSKALPTLVARSLVVQRGNHLETIGGHRVAVGAGYPGTSPAGTAPALTETWIYGTSPIFGFSSSIRTSGQVDSIDRANNSQQMLAERTYVLGWDCCQIGVPIRIGVDFT